jgi:hypothetical protein
VARVFTDRTVGKKQIESSGRQSCKYRVLDGPVVKRTLCRAVVEVGHRPGRPKTLEYAGELWSAVRIAAAAQCDDKPRTIPPGEDRASGPEHLIIGMSHDGGRFKWRCCVL